MVKKELFSPRFQRLKFYENFFVSLYLKYKNIQTNKYINIQTLYIYFIYIFVFNFVNYTNFQNRHR